MGKFLTIKELSVTLITKYISTIDMRLASLAL